MVRPVVHKDKGFKVFQHGRGLTGLAIKMRNGTGAPTVKGSVVAISPSADNSFILQSNEFDSIGVVAESGKIEYAWVIIQGVAQVLWKDATASTRGYVALSADTDGRAISVEVPTSNPVAAQHFKEIGHCMESKGAGTNVLVNVLLHFN